MAQAPAYCVDVNGCTFAAEGAGELIRAVERLGGWLQLKNSYRRTWANYPGYRDMKLWVPVPSPDGPMLFKSSNTGSLK